MAVKLVVMYPLPTNVDAFEYAYNNEHVPLAVENLNGKTKIVATKVLSSPLGTASFHRVAEVYFPSLAALAKCAASEGGKLTIGMRFPYRRGVHQPSLSPRKKHSYSRKPRMEHLDLP